MVQGELIYPWLKRQIVTKLSMSDRKASVDGRALDLAHEEQGEAASA